jgi:hypothetical protein
VNVRVLVVDDEPDVKLLFRQQRRFITKPVASPQLKQDITAVIADVRGGR